MITFPELPQYAANATHIVWEPVMGSGERITAAVALADEAGSVKVINLLSPDILSILYRGQGVNAASLLGMVSENLKIYLNSHKSISGWVPPVSGFHAEPMREFVGQNQEDILDQVAGLHSSLYKARAPQKPARLPTQGDESIRKRVREAARKMIGLEADRIFTPDGVIEVLDGGHKHFLDISIKTTSKVGSIISARYASPSTIEKNFLRAQSNLAVASEQGKYTPGLFIALPSGAREDANQQQIDNIIDDIYWRSSKLGHHIESSVTPKDLASEIIEWAA